VRRQVSVVTPPSDDNNNNNNEGRLLKTEYEAATNRMLRVAVNSFMESLKLVLEVMEHLDVDVLEHQKLQKPPS
jgi:EKC/KEOPS complex subunit PCC1/LAGE3